MKDEAAYRRFIEEMGDLIEEHGLPHMAGRVVGALFVCVPPHMTMEELAVNLHASKGAISMATQLLLRLELIEKLSLPGERRRHYRLRPGLLEELYAVREEHLSKHRRLFDAGLDLLRNEPIEHGNRLIEFQAFTQFLHEELPLMQDRWQARRQELIRRGIEETRSMRRRA